MAIQAETVREYLRKYPEMPSLTLAKLIYRENPSVFTCLDDARGRVRYLRGQSGKHHRKYLSSVEFVLPPSPRNPFEDLPEGLTDFHEWKPYHIQGSRILLLADVHIPFHDKPALTAALRCGQEKDVDTIFLNGDFLDFFSVSFFEKDPRKRDFRLELDAAQRAMTCIRSAFPKARIYLKLGNHEERYERYMRVKAPELLGIKKFELSNLIDAPHFKIDIIGEKRICKIGKLFVLHGHEVGKAIFSPVNPARGLYMRGKENVLGAHHHQTSQHTEKTMGENIISAWSVGCLCDLHPEYLPINNWNHGFAVVSQDAEGNFEVDNKKIIKGVIYNS